MGSLLKYWGPSLYESWSAPSPGTSTYDNQVEWCEDRGQRLCTYAEICSGGDQSNCGVLVDPVFGTISGDHWVAFDDPSQPNAWVQIGDSRSPLVCHTHHNGCEVHSNPPSWGVEGDVAAHEAHVVCCPKPIGNLSFYWDWCLDLGSNPLIVPNFKRVYLSEF